MMNCEIDEEHPRHQDIERGPELRTRGLGDHARNLRGCQRPDCIMKVIHKRLRATNLPVEEEVGEDRERRVQEERCRQETQVRPHTVNNAVD